MPQKKLLFLTLNTFSSTGGIEKVCRVAGKALEELADANGTVFSLYAMNDLEKDLLPQYVSGQNFLGFGGNRLRFVLESVRAGRKSDTVILSHINLLVIGFLVKTLSPKTKVILVAHGIEVWEPLPSWKIKALKKLNLTLPVSEFTKEKMKTLYGLADDKLKVLNNCLDPFLERRVEPAAAIALKESLGLSTNSLVLFTLTRIKSSEKYKGYDRVIAALPAILRKYPNAKYLIAGKYDTEEKGRMDGLIESLGLEGKVIFAGFVPDEDIESFFSLADIYVMPSTGEGFGIVFIEALFYGKPVIAGNKDGSVDALAKGAFGRLIDPDDVAGLAETVVETAGNMAQYIPDAQKVENQFGFATYKKKLAALLQLSQSL